jgi:hypothetical protein
MIQALARVVERSRNEGFWLRNRGDCAKAPDDFTPPRGKATSLAVLNESW